MELGRELRAAAELATLRVDGPPTPERARALAWLPIAGLAFGAIAAVLAAIAGAWSAVVAGVAAAAVLALLGGRAAPPALRALAAVVDVVAVAWLAPGARPLALLVAPMLARWAVVVQCYGGRARAAELGLAGLVGRAGFREFGIASVVALGVSLVVLDAVGLVVAVASALVTLAVRIVAYGRTGGLSAGALNATSALVETSALVLLSWIGVLLRP